jgi:hypothetical protein
VYSLDRNMLTRHASTPLRPTKSVFRNSSCPNTPHFLKTDLRIATQRQYTHNSCKRYFQRALHHRYNMEYPEEFDIIDAEVHLSQLCEAVKKAKIRRGQKVYAIDYMKMHAGKYVKQSDLLLYCDSRRREDTGGNNKNYSDNSRQVELLRKNNLPLEWDERYIGRELWYRYDPSIKDRYTDDVIAQHADKNQTFSSEVKKSKLKEANFACEITGIPFPASKDLNADHFIPREKGGASTSDNCVIISAHLNTTKNKQMPIEWFCKSLLTNFMNICKRVGLLDEAKAKLKQFIDEF